MVGLLLAAVVVCTLFIVLNQNNSEDQSHVVQKQQTKKKNEKFQSVFETASLLNKEILDIRLDIEPEFLRAMYAAIPKEKCSKARYKKVPVKRVVINGVVHKGKNWVRLRGYCFTHWATNQKSMKLTLENSFNGYRTLNINAIETDKTLLKFGLIIY